MPEGDTTTTAPTTGTGNVLLDVTSTVPSDLLRATDTEIKIGVLDLGEGIEFENVIVVPETFAPTLTAPEPGDDELEMENQFNKLNAFSTNLNTLIGNETKRINGLSDLYKAYDKLNAAKVSPDGITTAQKEILLEHLNHNIQIIQSNNNLSVAKANQQIGKMSSDAAVAKIATSIKSDKDPMMPQYVGSYNVPKNA
jgi:hypothetical protein